MRRLIIISLLILLFFNIGFTQEKEKDLSVGLPINLSNFNISNPKTYPEEILALIFEPLFEVELSDFKIIPKLAKFWKILNNGKEWIIHLRKDIEADDVLFSFKLFESNVKVEKIDKYIVKIIFSKPSRYSLIYLPYIIPKNFLKNKEIVGTGPFILKKYENKKFFLEKNPNSSESFPFERLIISTDYSLNEDLDILRVLPKDFDKLQSIKNYKIYDLGPDFESDILVINQNPSAPIPKYKLSWFQKVNFRKALALAINKELIIDEVYYKYAYTQDTPINKKSLFYTDNISKYSYSLEKAQNLLENMGFKDRNSDGYLEDIKGNLLELNILLEENEEIEKIAKILKKDLEKLKIKVNFVNKSSLYIRLLSTFNWELAILKYKWNKDPVKDSKFYLSKGSNHFWNPFQRIPLFSWEKEIDRLFNAFLEEENIGRKKLLFYDLQRIWTKNIPLIVISSPAVIYLAKEDIELDKFFQKFFT